MTTLRDTLGRYGWWLLAVPLVLGAAYAPVLQRLVANWYLDDNYSHGFLIPIIAGWFVWRDWDNLKAVEVKPSSWGLLVILLGLVQFAFAWLATELFNMRLSLIVVLAGCVLYLFGVGVFKRLRLPIGYLVLMVPLPYILYDALAFPLKLFVAKVSVGVLKLMGYAVWREGNIIAFPNIVLEVADACSGLRSLVSLIALAVTLAFLTLKSPWTRLLLVISAIPFAVLTNIIRVVATGQLAHHYGQAAAEGFFHEFAGLAVFCMAMFFLGGTCFLLRLWEKRHEA
ncbi:exosortase/archaeosortase family protein [Pseudodesulfovibrio thermohalotolerans]|uniref:exosortase A n=1 Tax=Pseudodesulfovibrio thermohalotolerans TaxID=2880651 RepID=UPI00244307FB|nr:exosortase A [Pseudodesulfovibrio thermohalotolerans]WFS61603.1 exosortase/archaeosortase family protein [Pseudodesulfovibrio thermohalotolerans]